MNDENVIKLSKARQIRRIEEYRGTCADCKQPCIIRDFSVLVLWRTADDSLIVVALDDTICPHCKAPLGTIEITGIHLPNTSAKLKPSPNARLN